VGRDWAVTLASSGARGLCRADIARSENGALVRSQRPVMRQAATEGFEWEKWLKSAEIARFSEGVAHSQVLILDDARHWIFVSNEEDVSNAIDAFVDPL
jgi:hypothetical protein